MSSIIIIIRSIANATRRYSFSVFITELRPAYKWNTVFMQWGWEQRATMVIKRILSHRYCAAMQCNTQHSERARANGRQILGDESSIDRDNKRIVYIPRMWLNIIPRMERIQTRCIECARVCVAMHPQHKSNYNVLCKSLAADRNGDIANERQPSIFELIHNHRQNCSLRMCVCIQRPSGRIELCALCAKGSKRICHTESQWHW